MKHWFLIKREVNSPYEIVTMEVAKNGEIEYTIKCSFRSCGYKSKKDLLEGEEILKKSCKICGGLVSTKYREPLASVLKKENICFTCNFWKEKEKIKNNPTTVRIDNNHYLFFPNDLKAVFQGFGGREFKIKFKDGREVTTKNLWHQGTIPERFREKLPDNAEFI